MQIYIHVPFCNSRCAYCDFTTSAVGRGDEEQFRRYTDFLLRRIAARDADFPSYQIAPVSSVYFGGGTPSILPVRFLDAIVSSIRKEFVVNADAEWTIEINPRTLTQEKAAFYKSVGINRASVGMQSADDGEFRILTRPHTHADYLKTVDMLLKNDILNISTDIMFGLPYQTISRLAATVDAVPKEVSHISAYSLELYDDAPISGKSYSYPTVDAERDMYYILKEKLEEREMFRYEISNFSKRGFESKHNIGYWTREDYIGFGISAHSLLNGRRYENRFVCSGDYADYAVEMIEDLDRFEEFKEAIILGLRLQEGIDTVALENRYGFRLEEHFASPLKKLESQGLIRLSDTRISLSDRGFDLANRVFSEFI